MNRFDLVLEWMTFTKRGTWTSFKRAVASSDPNDVEPERTAWLLAQVLTETYCAQFFVGGDDNWQVYRPFLGGLEDNRKAVLCGGRSARLVSKIKEACASCRAHITLTGARNSPTLIEIEDNAGALLPQIAEHARLEYVPRLGLSLGAALPRLESVLDDASDEAPPLNWSTAFFDPVRRTWERGFGWNRCVEYSSRYGAKQYFVARNGRHLRMERKLAVFAGARLRGVRLVSYDQQSEVVTVPLNCPLPDAAARCAASCMGMPAERSEGNFVYKGVPYEIAGAVLLSIGQSVPEPKLVRG